MGSITVSHLGKAYKQYPNRWSRFFEWVSPFKETHHTLNWVLQGVSFTVQQGEAVGIVGMNGAGKSTLLKMIAGTTQPTTGSLQVTGRIAAMLELGMGFHPDFTGRQNAYMAGQLLGYSMEDLFLLMPEIEAFAEIGGYLDQPVRVYSSGMQMRLAFSVATASRPDILIVDEALSVGDAYFQHKSFDRIREFSREGTTLLIVSHDKSSIQSICDRAILLNSGLLAMEGEPEMVLDYYNAAVAESQNSDVQMSPKIDGKFRIDSGTREAVIESVNLLNKKGNSVKVVSVGEDLVAELSVKINSDIDGLVLGFGIKDRLGQMMFGTNTFNTNQRIDQASKGDIIQIQVNFSANLGVGTYSVHCSLVSNDNHIDCNYHWIDRAMVFEVINVDKPVFVGSMWNPLKFAINKIDR